MTAVSHEHLRLAGYALAHGLASIQAGGPLCTLALVSDGSKQDLYRYEAPSIAESLSIASTHLADRLGASVHAALVFDGYATVDGERRDALMVRLLGPGAEEFGTLIQQYRPARSRILGLLHMVGLLRSGGLTVVGPFVLSDSLPAEAVDDVRAGFFEHFSGRRLYGGPR